MSLGKRLINTGGGGGFPEGNIAIVTSFGSKIIAVDRSNPAALSIISELTSPEFTQPWRADIDKVNNIAFVCDRSANKVFSIDVSDPSNMTIISSIAITGPYDIQLDLNNNVAYVVTDGQDTMYSIDISNPSSMVLLHSLTDSINLDYADRLQLDLTNNVAYTIGYRNFTSPYITSINISNPNSFSVLSRFDFSKNPQDIALDVARDTAYIACDGTSGDYFQSINISNPSSMSLRGVSSINSLRESKSIVFDSSRDALFMGAQLNGGTVSALELLSTSVISARSYVDNINWTSPTGLALDENNRYLYVATWQYGRLISVDTNDLSAISVVNTLNTGYGAGFVYLM